VIARPTRVWCAIASALAAASVALIAAVVAADLGPKLRVCADPNNLPFSNEAGEGFENRLADMIAAEMHATVQYTWWAQRRGFVRNTLRAGVCDVIMGVPSSYALVRATRSYYRSSYVFVYRSSSGFTISSFDDPILRTLRIGVHVIGDDAANAPPAHALSSRGIVNNLVGYTIYGDYRRPNPPARLIEAVAAGDIDVAIAWGPLAGYFASREAEPLAIVPVSPEFDRPFLPFVYDISMGVRREDAALQARLDEILTRKAREIDELLGGFGVPHAQR
jgi:mxaJ protein